MAVHPNDGLPSLGRKLSELNTAKNRNGALYGFYAFCAFLFVADFLYKKKSYSTAEGIPGFYPLAGLLSCIALVMIAKALRKLVLRDEAFYAPKDTQAEDHPEQDLNSGEAQ